MATKNAEAIEAANRTYEWGFHSDIEQDFAPKGLTEDTVRYISAKKKEPEWLLEWRLKAYRHWLTMEEPRLAESYITRRSIIRTAYTTLLPNRRPGQKAFRRSIRNS